LGAADLVDEAGHARVVAVEIPEGDLHRDAARREIVLEPLLDVGHAAEGDGVDAVRARGDLALRVALGEEHRGQHAEREEDADHGEAGAGSQSVPRVAMVNAMPQKSTKALRATKAPW